MNFTFAHTKLSELSNFEIDIMLKRYNNYGGCIAKNETNKIKNGKFYIMNLNNSNQSGSHWTYLSNKHDNIIYYIDSFGAPPPESIEKYAKEHGKSIFYNKRVLQALDASSCGFFTVFVSDQFKAGKTFDQVINMFSDSVDENERMLKEYFKNRK